MRLEHGRFEWDRFPSSACVMCVEYRTGRPVVAQANQKSQTKQKRNHERTGDPLCSDIPESLFEYHPISAKDQSRINRFGKKVLPGLFLGYALYAVGIWKGDVLVADFEELESMDASEIYSRRLNAKEVIFPNENGTLNYPVADGRIKLPGRDQELRTPTLTREHPIRGEGHVQFLGESEGSLPPLHDSFPDAGEAINDFWSMSGNFIYRHHVEPRVTLYSPREESFPRPLICLTHQELQERIWMPCKNAASMTIGTSTTGFHSVCSFG